MSTVGQPAEHGDGARHAGAAAGRGVEDDEHGLVQSETGVAGNEADAEDTAAYDGTTVDHGDTPGQRGSVT